MFSALNLEGEDHLVMPVELHLLQLSTCSSELQPVLTKTKFYLWHSGEVWTYFSAITTSVLIAHGETEYMLLVRSKDLTSLLSANAPATSPKTDNLYKACTASFSQQDHKTEESIFSLKWLVQNIW